jgi:mortality factor 4-like protein 1
MKLNVPEILKVLLVDDWEAVTKNNQVRPFVDVFGCTANI